MFGSKKKKEQEKKAFEKERRQEADIRALIKTKQIDENKHQKAFISLNHINKIYDNHVQAVFDFNLDIYKNDFIVLVGPSGCGKSTTLRMIAGLEDITTGDLIIDGNYSNDTAPKDRDIAMVFQSYALYPHMTVFDNMAFGLKIRHMKKEVIAQRVHEAAKILQIEEYLDRKPKALSGGQRQRVALGRAIVRHAKAFLMDEPLSNLDAKLRVQMRSEIIKLHETLGATTIYVTHDQTEAMTMATRIVVMKDGIIQQIGTPYEIFSHPSNIFVATFIGSPAMNIIGVSYDDGIIILPNGMKIRMGAEFKQAHDRFYSMSIEQIDEKKKELEKRGVDANEYQKELISRAIIKLSSDRKQYAGFLKSSHSIKFGIRPEDIYDYDDFNLDKFGDCIMDIDVSVAELLGNEYFIHSSLGNVDFVSKIPSDRIIKAHDKIKVILNLRKAHIFDPVSGDRVY